MRSRASVVVRVVEIELCEQQLGVGEVRIDLERALGRGGGRRRIVFRQRAREAGVRRRPAVVLRERLLERLHRLGPVVLFEEQQPPGRIDRGIGSECGSGIGTGRSLRARGRERRGAGGAQPATPDPRATAR